MLEKGLCLKSKMLDSYEQETMLGCVGQRRISNLATESLSNLSIESGEWQKN